MREPRDTKGPDETIGHRCSGSASPRTTRREFMIASSAAALSVGAVGWARPAWGEEPKPLLTPLAEPVKKCSLRVVWVGKDAALGQAESLTKALDSTARKLDVGLDSGTPDAAPPDGLLIVALNGKKEEALAEAAKAAAVRAVVVCPAGQGPAGASVWQLGESKAGLLVGTSKEEKDVVYGLRMLHAAWKVKGNARIFRLSFHSPAYAAAQQQVREDKAAQEEAEAFADYYMKEAEEIRRAKWMDLVYAGLVYVCMRRIMTANKYDGIGLSDCLQSYRAMGTNPCVPAMRLLDEGLPAACEGDMSGLDVQLLTHWLFGRPSYIAEGQPTLRNTRINAHCTSPSKLNGYDQPHEPFDLMSHSETGRGVAPDVKWKIGQDVTVFRARTRLGTGHIVSNTLFPPNGGCHTSIEYTIDGMADVGRPGTGLGSPHSMVVYGNVEREMDAFWTLVQGKLPYTKYRDVPAQPKAEAPAEDSTCPSCPCCRWAHCPGR
ncbi:MAG: hypothetical protein NTW87_06910 [Planctomycetota bacterium]|nr:hypothetical protein [Planctomycetota bacterium]